MVVKSNIMDILRIIIVLLVAVNKYAFSYNHVEWIKSGHSADMEERLRSVEERLRSIEQPMWLIESASTRTWSRCTEGGTGCQCDPTTMRLRCRNMIKFLPPNQVLPSDILVM